MPSTPSFPTWFETFEPELNTFDEDASFDGCLFETYGEQLEHVHAMEAEDGRRVWTLLEVDGEQFVCAGFHRVNALGYFITSKSLDKDDEEQRQLYLDQDISVDS